MLQRVWSPTYRDGTVNSKLRGLNPLRAIAEISLIVVGILLAFSIDRWWSGVERRELERDYLTRLDQDFGATRAELSRAVAEQDRFLAAGRKALALLSSGKVSAINDSLPECLSTVFAVGPVATHMATYEELRSSGNLHLIRNDALRAALARYDAFVRGRFATAESVWLQEWFERVRPYAERKLIPELYLTSAQMSELMVPATPIRRTSTDVSRDPELWNLIVHRLIVASVARSVYEEGLALINDVVAALGHPVPVKRSQDRGT